MLAIRIFFNAGSYIEKSSNCNIYGNIFKTFKKRLGSSLEMNVKAWERLFMSFAIYSFVQNLGDHEESKKTRRSKIYFITKFRKHAWLIQALKQTMYNCVRKIQSLHIHKMAKIYIVNWLSCPQNTHLLFFSKEKCLINMDLMGINTNRTVQKEVC